MKTLKILLISITIIFFGAIMALFLAGKNKNNIASNANNQGNGKVAGATTEENDDYLVSLSKSLTDKGVVLYCSFQSEDCIKQKSIFQGAIKYINYVECDASGPSADADGCVGQGVESYPTWIYQGKHYIGIQTLANLAKIINFSE